MGNRQYAFVIQYDVDSKEFSIDIDTLNAKFNDGPIYYGNGSWGNDIDSETNYLNKENILANILEKANTHLEEQD